jgi:hypothetical protein
MNNSATLRATGNIVGCIRTDRELAEIMASMWKKRLGRQSLA